MAVLPSYTALACVGVTTENCFISTTSEQTCLKVTMVELSDFTYCVGTMESGTGKWCEKTGVTESCNVEVTTVDKCHSNMTTVTVKKNYSPSIFNLSLLNPYDGCFSKGISDCAPDGNRCSKTAYRNCYSCLSKQGPDCKAPTSTEAALCKKEVYVSESLSGACDTLGCDILQSTTPSTTGCTP